MAKALIITVGTGETVSHGICFSVRQQNPDLLIFILTSESQEKTLSLIRQDRIMKDRKSEEVILGLTEKCGKMKNIDGIDMQTIAKIWVKLHGICTKSPKNLAFLIAYKFFSKP